MKPFISLGQRQLDAAQKLSPSLQTLSRRVQNCLCGANLLTDDAVCAKSAAQLLKLRNFGRVCLREVAAYLRARGRRLADGDELVQSESAFHRHAAAVAQFAKYPDSGTGTIKALTYCALGIAGEAGEVADKVKKVLRDHDGVLTDEARRGLSAELGDVLWYFMRCCAELGFDPEKVAAENVEKLTSRQQRGVIGGSGDKR